VTGLLSILAQGPGRHWGTHWGTQAQTAESPALDLLGLRPFQNGSKLLEQPLVV
jgi:hypothetical protein